MDSETAVKPGSWKTELGNGIEKSWRARTVGFVLLSASAVLYAVSVALLVFAPLPPEWRFGTAAVLAVAAEGASWLSAVLLGREVVQRYRRTLNPLTWFGEKEKWGMGHFRLKKRAQQLLGESNHDV